MTEMGTYQSFLNRFWAVDHMQVYVQGVGICGPGLNGWEKSSSVLAGLAPYRFEPMPQASPSTLPAAERRRSSESARLAVAVGLEAMHNAGMPLARVKTVFASSDGDGQIVHLICETLASNPRDVSPTRFHNSVHNAAAGYWSIAARSQEPSTSLCAFDASFAAGLLEVAAQIVVDRQPVLLIAFDLPFPPPLAAVHRVDHGFAAAVVMTAEAGLNALGQWRIGLQPEGIATPLAAEFYAPLRSNPAARCLPLLIALAKRKAAVAEDGDSSCAHATSAATGGHRETIRLEYLDRSVLVVETD